MKLGFEEAQAPYESPSQSARYWTEAWVRQWAFCPSCGNPKLAQHPNNNPAADFYCIECREDFELKSQRNKFGAKIVDGAFRTMTEKIRANKAPNLVLLNYDLKRLAVTSLCVVPKHFLAPSLIEQRKPLAATARRAGWVGCNILVGNLPASGRISIVRDGEILPKEVVIAQWRQTLFLRNQDVDRRTWLLEVMRCIETLHNSEFDLEQVYSFEGQLSQLYPENRNIRPKIRQQLQVLRDNGYLDFLGQGRYRLRTTV